MSGEYAYYVRKAPQIDKSDIFNLTGKPTLYGIKSDSYGSSFVVVYPGDMVVVIGTTANGIDGYSSWTRSSIILVPFILPTVSAPAIQSESIAQRSEEQLNPAIPLFNNGLEARNDASLPDTISRGDILHNYAKVVDWIDDVRDEWANRYGFAQLVAKGPAPGHLLDFIFGPLIAHDCQWTQGFGVFDWLSDCP